MENKIFGLMTLGILSLVILINLTSAVSLSDITEYSIPTNVSQNAGSFTITFNLTNNGVAGTLDFNASTVTSGATIVFDDTAIADGSTTSVKETITATVTFPSTMTGNIAGLINVTGTSMTTSKTLAYSVPITIPPVTTTTFCAYDNGVSTNLGELDIDIKDITVKEGFGDDEEWALLDEVEIEIKVENKGDYDVDSISLEWGIAKEDFSEWIIEMDEEDEFNLKDGKEKTYFISFRIDEKTLDVDFDELNEDYKLYVRITGDIDDSNSPNDGDATCASDSADVKTIVESDFLILYKLTASELVSCGDNVQITADIWNIGDNDQEEVYIKIFNSALGINERINIGDVNAFDKESLDALVKIPKDAEEKVYYLQLGIYDEDEDIFESNEFNDDAEFFVTLNVKGNCVSSTSNTKATVSAVLESGGKAGEPLVIKSTIVNSGTGSSTYKINPAGYASWASSATTDLTEFTLNSGESKAVTITLDVKDDASGEQSFNIEILSGTELVKTQPVSVTIEGKSSFSNLTGKVTSGSGLIWGVGLLNVILILVIIIVAIKVARR